MDGASFCSKRGVRALAPVTGSLPRRHDAQALEAHSRKRKLSVGDKMLLEDERSLPSLAEIAGQKYMLTLIWILNSRTHFSFLILFEYTDSQSTINLNYLNF